MRFVFTLMFALLLLIPPTFSQGCIDYLGRYYEETGDTYFGFKAPFHVAEKFGEKNLDVNGYMWSKTFALVVEIDGVGMCTTKDAKVLITFSDGTTLELKDDFGPNCKAKLAFFFSDTLNTLDKLELLKQKRIKSLKAWASNDRFFQTKLDTTTSAQLNRSIKCLAHYFGQQPPAPKVKKHYDINVNADTAQACTTLLSMNEREPSFQFTRAIPFDDDKSQLAIALIAYANSNSLRIELMGSNKGLCADQGDSITFRFSDGSLFHASNQLQNCEGAFVVKLPIHDDTSGLLTMLKTKDVTQLALRHKGIVIKGDLRSSRPQLLKKSFNCLYRGVTTEGLIQEFKSVEENTIFTVVEQHPEYEGGHVAMINFIKKNLKTPKNTSGTVYVQFVVGKDGSVQDVKVVRGLSPEADAEAARVVSKMPPWKPGKQNGKPVYVRFVLPLKF